MRAEQFNPHPRPGQSGNDYEKLVNEVVLRSQAQAEYAAENYGHFGLNLRRYAHFTSPIRRYADLIVHRGLIRAGHFGPDGLPDSQDAAALTEIAAQAFRRPSAAPLKGPSATNDPADRASSRRPHRRASLGPPLRCHPRRPVRGSTKTGAARLHPAHTIGARNISATRSLCTPWSASRTGETHRLGDRVTVKLVEAAPVAGALACFEPLMSDAKIMTGAQPRRLYRTFPGGRVHQERHREKPFRGGRSHIGARRR